MRGSTSDHFRACTLSAPIELKTWATEQHHPSTHALKTHAGRSVGAMRGLASEWAPVQKQGPQSSKPAAFSRWVEAPKSRFGCAQTGGAVAEQSGSPAAKDRQDRRGRAALPQGSVHLRGGPGRRPPSGTAADSSILNHHVLRRDVRGPVQYAAAWAIAEMQVAAA